MKRAFFSNFIGAGLMAMGLATLPSTLPAAAQTAAPPVDPAAPTDTVPPASDPTLNTAPDTTTSEPYEATEGDRDFDWGWLGLLGLIGLAGLARKPEDPVARYREPDEVSSTTGPRY